MQDAIQPGTILIKESARLPEGLTIESAPAAAGWKIVKRLDGYALDRKIRAAGWTFFCLAGEVKVVVFGFSGDSSQRAAIKRILANPKSNDFNSLEIIRAETKHLLGLSYTSVRARPRHIQESIFLYRTDDVRQWDQAKIARDLNESRSPMGTLKLPRNEQIIKPAVATTANL